MAEAQAAAAAAAARNRTVAKAPEEFSLKKNFNTWIKQFRNYVELLNVPPNDTYRTLLSFCNPECFDLIEALGLTPAQRNDIFDQAVQRRLKDALKSREIRVDPGYLLKYRKQNENETIEKYADELLKLAQEVYPDDQNIRQNPQLISSFIGGVRNDELAIKLLQEDFPNLTNAVQAASQYFQALQTRRFIKTETDFRAPLEKVYEIREPASVNRVYKTQPRQQMSVEQPAGRDNETGGQPQQATQALQYAQQANMPTMQQTQPGNVVDMQQLQQVNAPNAQQMVPINMPNMQQIAPLNVHNTQPTWQGYNYLPYANFPQNINDPRGFRNDRYSTRGRGSSMRGACHFCGEYGHYIADCEQKKRMGQGQQRKYCTYCGMSNHNRETCYRLHPHLGDAAWREKENNRRQGYSKNARRPM